MGLGGCTGVYRVKTREKGSSSLNKSIGPQRGKCLFGGGGGGFHVAKGWGAECGLKFTVLP